MKKIFLIILFSKISFFSSGKLLYKCNSVVIGSKQLNDINVVFMTGYEVLENLPENKLSIVKAKQYAMILLDNEISVVLLDDFYRGPDYNTNCRLVYTKRCLPDLGNSTLYGKELSSGKNVAIYPSNFDI
tara:strand:+ start:1274 stop:1663 length:390 start_codon:yes stop_codon:yes gene_type:complete